MSKEEGKGVSNYNAPSSYTSKPNYSDSQDIKDTVRNTNDAANAETYGKLRRNLRYSTELAGDRHYNEDLKQQNRSDLYNRNTALSKKTNELLGDGMSSFVDINGKVRGYKSKSVQDAISGKINKDDKEALIKYLESNNITVKTKSNKLDKNTWIYNGARQAGIDIDKGKFKNNETGWDDEKLKKFGLDDNSYNKYLNSDEDSDTSEYFDENGQKIDSKVLGDRVRNFYADKFDTTANDDQKSALEDSTYGIKRNEIFNKKRDEAAQNLGMWDDKFNQEKHGFISKFIHNKIKKGMKNRLNQMNYDDADSYDARKKNDGLLYKINKGLASLSGMDTDGFSILDLKSRIHRDYVDFSKRKVVSYKPISKSEVSLLEDSLNSSNSNKFKNFSAVDNKNNPYLNWDTYIGI